MRLNKQDRSRLFALITNAQNDVEDEESQEDIREFRSRVFRALDAPPNVEANDPRVLAKIDEVAQRIHHVRDVQESKVREELQATTSELRQYKESVVRFKKLNDSLIHQMRLNKHAMRMGRAALRFLSEAGKAR